MSENSIKGPIQSVSRAAAILRCFFDYQTLSLQEISNMVGLHKSTTSTLVTTLKNEQFLEQEPGTSRYRLGMNSFLLGANTKINLRTITQPYLLSLNERFRETVNLAAPDGSDIIYVNKLESEYSMRTCTRIGQRLPFYCTANGKVIFAHYSPERLQSIFNGLHLKRFTQNTISDIEALRQELIMARSNGYACDNEELEEGLCCFATPIFDRSSLPVAAISLSGPTFRMNSSAKEDMVAELMACASAISEVLSKSSYIVSAASMD